MKTIKPIASCFAILSLLIMNNYTFAAKPIKISDKPQILKAACLGGGASSTVIMSGDEIPVCFNLVLFEKEPDVHFTHDGLAGEFQIISPGIYSLTLNQVITSRVFSSVAFFKIYVNGFVVYSREVPLYSIGADPLGRYPTNFTYERAFLVNDVVEVTIDNTAPGDITIHPQDNVSSVVFEYKGTL